MFSKQIEQEAQVGNNNSAASYFTSSNLNFKPKEKYFFHRSVFYRQVILLLILMVATLRETLFLLNRLHYDYYRNINLNQSMLTI